ncbi:MAG: AsmA family protein [Candidatus Omnitrophota bacterium]
MKKFFIILSVVFLIGTGSILIFLLTLDVNQYKGMISDSIAESIKMDVKLGDLSLSVLPEIAFRINGISIKDKKKGWEDPILKVASIEASLKLLPLIRKDIQIQKLRIRGLELSVNKEEKLIEGMSLGKDSADVGLATAGAIKFLAKRITISDSIVNYIDGALELELSIIEANIKNISLYGASDIDARLSVFGRGRENIKLSTTLYPEIETKKPYLKNLDIRIDVSNINITDLLDAVGSKEVKSQLANKKLDGELAIFSNKMYLDPTDIMNSDLEIELLNGTADILPVSGSIDGIELKAGLSKGSFIIDRLKGDIADGSFLVKGNVKNILSKQDSKFDITLEDISIKKLLPKETSRKPSFEGTLNTKITSNFSGLKKESIFETLSVEGDINLDDPVLKNMNVLRVVLDQLDMIPGLARKLENKLPDYYRKVLEEDHTYFEPIESNFRIRGSKVLFDELQIISDAFFMTGKNISLDMDSYDLSSSSYYNFFIPKDLSEVFISAVNELKYLANNEGIITMPLSIYGRLPNITISPDLDYVISRLAVSKGQELLEDLFGRGSKEEEASSTESGESKDTQQEKEVKPGEILIKTIFDIISSPNE